MRFSHFDNDGDADLILANGHSEDLIGLCKPEVSNKQELLLFENRGANVANVSDTAGSVFEGEYPARGLAVGDYDGDGDVLVSNSGAAPLLLRNDTERRTQWVGLHLMATESNPEGVGAVIAWKAGGLERSRLRTSGGSYLASHDRREILGLGPASDAEWIEIRWPSGTVDRLEGVTPGKYHAVRDGAGIVP